MSNIELEFIEDIDKWVLFGRDGMPIESVTNYLNLSGSLNSNNAKKNAGETLKVFFRWLETKGQEYNEIDTEDYLDFEISVTSNIDSTKTLSSKSWNQYNSRLKRFYDWDASIRSAEVNILFTSLHQTKSHYSTNRLLHSKKVGASNVKEKYISVEIFIQILKNLSLRDRLIILLFYTTGLRLGELLNLKASAFKKPIPEGELEYQLWLPSAQGNRFDEQTKTGPRELFTTTALVHKIRNYIMFDRVEGKKGNDILFTTSQNTGYSKRGDQLRASSIRAAFKLASKKAGYNFTIHDLRHTYITEMLMRGSRINDVKELVGHKNISTTSAYDHTPVKKRIEDNAPAMHNMWGEIFDIL